MERGSGVGGDWASSESFLSSGGAGEDVLEMTLGPELLGARVPGGGAPLTIWSSLLPDIGCRFPETREHVSHVLQR